MAKSGSLTPPNSRTKKPPLRTSRPPLAEWPGLPALRQAERQDWSPEGKTTRPGLCKCYACRKPFTVRMGTSLRPATCPAPVAAGHPPDVRQQEGHQHPPDSADARLLHENRLVPDPPHPRGHERLSRHVTEPMGGDGKIVEADETYVGRQAGHQGPPAGIREAARGRAGRAQGEVRSFHMPTIRANNLEA